MVEEGLDVLPIDASFRIIRKQQEPKILDSEKCVDLSIVNIRICLQMLVKFIWLIDGLCYSAISARFMRTTTCDCDMKKYENSGGGAENNLWRCAHVTFEFVWVRGQFWSLITDRHSGICTSMYRHSQSLRTYVWFWNTYNCLIIHHLWAFLSKFLAQFPPQKTPMSLSKPNSQPWSPRCRLQEWEASPCVALDR